MIDSLSDEKSDVLKDNVRIDLYTRCIQAIVVEKYSFFKLFCFFKETPCIVIPIECVVSIGGDVILVTLDG